MFASYKNRGFSLVELLVVCSIIIIIISIVLASILSARQDTRDKARVAYLAEIKFALELYREANREYPDYPEGSTVAPGSDIYTAIAPYLPNADPGLSDGENYYFTYDSDVSCGGGSSIVVYAKQVEQSKNANYNTVCGCEGEGCGFGEAGGIPDEGYLVFIKDNPTIAYAEGDYYSQSSYYAQSSYYGQSSYAPVYAQCTPSSNSPDGGRTWWGDWPDPPQPHNARWWSINGWQHATHRCCDGDVKVNKQIWSFPPYPSCN